MGPAPGQRTGMQRRLGHQKLMKVVQRGESMMLMFEGLLTNLVGLLGPMSIPSFVLRQPLRYFPF
jgi:hypothetical protein